MGPAQRPCQDAARAPQAQLGWQSDDEKLPARDGRLGTKDPGQKAQRRNSRQDLPHKLRRRRDRSRGGLAHDSPDHLEELTDGAVVARAVVMVKAHVGQRS